MDVATIAQCAAIAHATSATLLALLKLVDRLRAKRSQGLPREAA
jgi:hypothetical protein